MYLPDRESAIEMVDILALHLPEDSPTLGQICAILKMIWFFAAVAGRSHKESL